MCSTSSSRSTYRTVRGRARLPLPDCTDHRDGDHPHGSIAVPLFLNRSQRRSARNHPQAVERRASRNFLPGGSVDPLAGFVRQRIRRCPLSSYVCPAGFTCSTRWACPAGCAAPVGRTEASRQLLQALWRVRQLPLGDVNTVRCDCLELMVELNRWQNVPVVVGPAPTSSTRETRATSSPGRALRSAHRSRKRRSQDL